MLKHVRRDPVREGHRMLPAVRGFQLRRLIDQLGQPALERARFIQRREMLALIRLR
ncbi:hypothetical protein D3C77_382560 [compost metagenome]